MLSGSEETRRGWAGHDAARRGKARHGNGYLQGNQMAKTGLFEKSADTLIVENRLRNTTAGDVVTYGELTKLLGRDVRTFCKANVIGARHTLEGESIFFDTIAGEGLKRLTESEAVTKTAPSYVNRAKNAANRGMRVLAHVQYDSLDEATKRKHLSTSAQLGAIKLFVSAKATKAIESKVTETSKQLAIGETLKLFS